jgi:F-type H+-transporting ATPase subunit delta
MADSVGSVYSTALFELCNESGKLEKVFYELGQVCGIVFSEENADYAKFLESPLIGGEEKAKSLEAVFGGRIDGLTLDFLCLVAQKGRFSCLPQIFEEFTARYNEKMNILEVTAVTSVPMSDRLREKLKTKLETVSGKKIVLTEKVDRSILGGILLRYGNTQIDSSVKSRLDELKSRIGSVIA